MPEGGSHAPDARTDLETEQCVAMVANYVKLWIFLSLGRFVTSRDRPPRAAAEV
jgi:hypothetical protein